MSLPLVSDSPRLDLRTIWDFKQKKGQSVSDWPNERSGITRFIKYYSSFLALALLWPLRCFLDILISLRIWRPSSNADLHDSLN
ncbi:hypothetical protein A11Q_872 [Pseudobdellovibrio exovorus JSS]|uniref:Uncharacterized protein n=1 Tax=Pseudobdellovibrio exovorus JSS TaxID=1184267 RepID=M4VPN7_9BACT|nr:hypothetical protein A11Q_872 [Pseudobdellovibrio exovorus JSS]